MLAQDGPVFDAHSDHRIVHFEPDSRPYGSVSNFKQFVPSTRILSKGTKVFQPVKRSHYYEQLYLEHVSSVILANINLEQM